MVLLQNVRPKYKQDCLITAIAGFRETKMMAYFMILLWYQMNGYGRQPRSTWRMVSVGNHAEWFHWWITPVVEWTTVNE